MQVGKDGLSEGMIAALDTALAIIDQLRKVNRFDEATAALYQRVLPIAINPPFDRREPGGVGRTPAPVPPTERYVMPPVWSNRGLNSGGP